uniref:NADH dehydrogenase [ubiquinone] iron-sulfur protein 4, mitochondrial n=1 Tax=Physcomitrium patens TaxID=3218 RepID=A0A7I4AF66_PHYPA
MSMEPVRDVDLGYQYMGMSVCTVVAPERGREARNNSVQSRRRRRTVARRIALGVFRLPSCCTAPSTLEDPDPLSDNIGRNPRYAPTGEISPHIPYVPKYIHSREISRLPVKSKLQRKVIIYSPSSGTSMQQLQSTSKAAQWRIDYETETKWESSLKGWTSTGDSYLDVDESGLQFDSKEAAITFAEQYGWSYKVVQINSFCCQKGHESICTCLI